METFGIIGREFINLYSKENPILKQNEICYFLFTNTVDYHRPLMAKGLIVSDKFTDEMDKLYYIRIIELIESPNIIMEFFINKQFFINTYIENNDVVVPTKRTTIFRANLSYYENLIPVEAFFVRNTEEKIRQLRLEYCSIIKKDVLKQLKDIEEIL